MNFTLYETKSENIAVNKILTGDKGYEGNATSEIDVLNPVLLVASTDGLTTYNYCYIPDFKRYYFCKIKPKRNGLWQIDCHVDVLMTYKNQLLQEKAIIDRQESEANMYLIDNNFPVENKNQVYFKKFPNSLPNKNYCYLTIGG